MGVPELLGGSIGITIFNPIIWIAGYVVARTSPAKARFWIKLVIAAVVCTALHYGFYKWYDDDTMGLARWSIIVGLGTVWATIIFYLLRKLKIGLHGWKEG